MGSKNWTVKNLSDLTTASVNQQMACARLHRARIGRFNNTAIMWHGGSGTLTVRLHETDIVKINQDGEVRLYTGGWRTVTTRRRINEVLEALDPCGLDVDSIRVRQTNSEWYLYTHHFATNGEGCYTHREDFEEGIYAGDVA
jgi:hypothetical protein